MRSTEKITALLPEMENTTVFGRVVTDGGRGEAYGVPYVEYAPVAARLERAIYETAEFFPALEKYQELLEERELLCGLRTLKTRDVSAVDTLGILSLLVYVLQAERFSEGTLLELLECGAITRWLRRLAELESETPEPAASAATNPMEAAVNISVAAGELLKCFVQNNTKESAVQALAAVEQTCAALRKMLD